MMSSDFLEREQYLHRHTKSLLWLELLMGGTGSLILFLSLGKATLPILVLGLVLSFGGLGLNAWRNVQRFRLMDEYEQLRMLKGVGAAFIFLMAAVSVLSSVFFFVQPVLEPLFVGALLALVFLAAFAILGFTEHQLSQ